MKRIVMIAMLVLFMVAGVSGEDFEKGQKFLTGQVGLNSFWVPFGASYSFAVTDNIEAGGTVMIAFVDGFTVLIPSVDGMYHFTSLELPVDLFAGLSLGYLIAMGDGATYSSSLDLTPFIGARYFFKSNLAVSLKVYFSILGDASGVGGLLGLTYILKK